jgi:bifunctional DNA-binding transcriptional regulator/antitoxin component of YhaV-PrlF toxin-antitoxin module
MSEKSGHATQHSRPVCRYVSHIFIWDVPHPVVGKEWMSTAILDNRGRVVLPREVLEELDASRGDTVVFEKKGKDFVVTKTSSKTKRLEEVMDWNPKRTGRVEKVSPKTMKEIWKT